MQLGLRNNLGKANIRFTVHVRGAHTAGTLRHHTYN